MAIPEDQLETWDALGAVTQSKETYATIKGVLEEQGAPYGGRGFTTFLQGSYGNDTNVFADSDVDVVMRLDDAFQHDLTRLSEPSREAFKKAHTNADYGVKEFRPEVANWLTQKYGAAVTVGDKAITVGAYGNRRETDVLACMSFRRYHKFNSLQDQEYVEGVCFYLPDGTRIENYPRQHMDNCTTKHQATNGWFKRTVRVVKNMRNHMRDDGLIADGLAPSYYLEGLLYNVPNVFFGGSYTGTITSAFDWIANCNRDELVCANRQFWLLRKDERTSWDPDDCQTFLNALNDYWRDW